jgi:signal transduction histidine kinase
MSDRVLLVEDDERIRQVLVLALGDEGFDIVDTGPGIPHDLRDRIFDRFARGTRSGRRGTGSGLGLALVAQHVQRHGGAVWVDDRPGGGARFVVEIPEASR